MYENCIKRLLDFCASALALLLLSPILLILCILGAIFMKGSPFFTQPRPGKDEKIFRLIKFRTMSCEKDANGDLLPDEQRLNKYGRFLRSTSLDELPELINILLGQMAIVGPRPLLVEYLPLYNAEQRRRHTVRPGLTGWAQVNGRNAISWEEKFRLDLEYVDNISLWMDLKVIFTTVGKIFKREGISSETAATMEKFTGTPETQEV